MTEPLDLTATITVRPAAEWAGGCNACLVPARQPATFELHVRSMVVSLCPAHLDALRLALDQARLAATHPTPEPEGTPPAILGRLVRGGHRVPHIAEDGEMWCVGCGCPPGTCAAPVEERE